MRTSLKTAHRSTFDCHPDDLAVVPTTGTTSPPAVAHLREGTPLRAGDAVIALGYLLSNVLTKDAQLSVGNVSALAGLADLI
jgi:hypothetical protein